MSRLRFALAIVLGMLLALAGTLALLTPNPWESMRLIAIGAFGSELGLTRTLVKWIPLVLAGLGVLVAWRGGMFNIGGEGQFVVGGIFAAFAVRPILDSGLHWLPAAILILACSTLGGSLWGLLAAWLYIKRGVDVVISTILLNFVAIQVLVYLVGGPLQERAGKLPQSDRLSSNLALPKFDPSFDLHYGVFLAPLLALAVYVFLYRTRLGFEVRLVGSNARAARANRIDAKRGQMLSMAVSGGLCGVAGGVEYLGVTQQLGQGFPQSWGFLAIPVALLGGLHPALVCLSALYFAAILGGTKNLAGFTADGTALIYIVQAAAVLGLVVVQRLERRRSLVAESA